MTVQTMMAIAPIVMRAKLALLISTVFGVKKDEEEEVSGEVYQPLNERQLYSTRLLSKIIWVVSPSSWPAGFRQIHLEYHFTRLQLD